MLTATIGIENSGMEPDRINVSPVLYSDLSNSTKDSTSAKISEINGEKIVWLSLAVYLICFLAHV